MLKTIKSLNRPASRKNNDSRPASKKNNGSKPVSGKNNGSKSTSGRNGNNSEIVKFCVCNSGGKSFNCWI